MEGSVSYHLALHCGWLVDWLAGWLVDWLAGWLVDWLAGWLADQLHGCPAILLSPPCSALLTKTFAVNP
jgi:fructose-specific phosphotransferase system IIC component